MIITTTFDVPGFITCEVLGVVSANQVLGNNLISENIAAFTDIFGGKSGQYRSKLDELIDDARNQLIQKATYMNADAIVGLSVSTNQISSKGMSMFMVTATGTAVRIETDRYTMLEKLHKLTTYHNERLLTDEEYNYEVDRVKNYMQNVVAHETRTALDRKKAQEEFEAERLRQREEYAKEYEKRHAEEIKVQEEAKRKYEEENAEGIRKKKELIDFVKKEFLSHKDNVETVDLSAVTNASYEDDLPKIKDLTHYDIMRYLVCVGNIAGACKYYCDKYHLTPSDAKDYLVGIYKAL